LPPYLRQNFWRSYDDLGGIVRESRKEGPHSRTLFVLFTKERDHVKILWNDEAGMCMHSKRLFDGALLPCSD